MNMRPFVSGARWQKYRHKLIILIYIYKIKTTPKNILFLRWMMMDGGISDLQRPGPPLREPSSGSPGLSCFPPASPQCEGLRARTALSAIAPCSRRSGAC